MKSVKPLNVFKKSIKLNCKLKIQIIEERNRPLI